MAANETTAKWDAEQGIWVGGMAQEGDEELPNPLVIFGYGSLCWRPDTTLESYESFVCYVHGWLRLFAQKSTDHRGTPDNPGLVATLCEGKVLESLPNFNSFATKTLGRGYIVPEEDVTKVLAELDFREKGGYTRRVVDVEKIDGSGTMKALLYTGTIDNPNFWWGEDGSGYDIEKAASIIASAVGPSGPNVDYLRNLSGFLKSMNSEDTHVMELQARVDRIALGSSQQRKD